MRHPESILTLAVACAALVPDVARGQELATIAAAPADTVRANWNSSLDDFGSAPAVFAVVCPPNGSVLESVWGTDEYTADSGLCMAAVHAGVLDLERGGVALVERRPGRGSYQGSVRHGITTHDYPAWPRSFRFVRLAAPTAGAMAEDVGSIEGIVKAWYEVVSGPAGAARQWDRDATLYLPGTVFVIPGEGSAPRVFAPAEWARANDAELVASGFVEREIHRVTHQFGRVAHVWSTYEWRNAGGETGRGINSIHLWNDGARWWITHATWESETEDRPIPAAYLSSR